MFYQKQLNLSEREINRKKTCCLMTMWLSHPEGPTGPAAPQKGEGARSASPADVLETQRMAGSARLLALWLLLALLNVHLMLG